MPNKADLGEQFTGLVILANSIPKTLTDANRANLRDCLIQCLHDVGAELDLGQEVDWEAAGEPADVIPVDRSTISKIMHNIENIATAPDYLTEVDHE